MTAMMETLRFAGDDDDDLYSGFDTVHPALDTTHLESDPGFQEAVRTSHGRRPPVSRRAGTHGQGIHIVLQLRAPLTYLGICFSNGPT